MSYETNPITNRLKITKGWKNPHFPAKTLNYSREMLLWFQVYLFLKAYLSFQQIRLLACEIRISEKNTKVLYLSVNKDRKEQKKTKKSKWRSKSFLYALKSPLTKVHSQNARFLLYQDFKSLKKILPSTVNSSQKKILSKAWLTKNRNSSWVNTAHLISKSRNRFLSKQQLYRISKAKIISFHFKYKNEHNLKQTFWKNKQRQIFSVLSKIQKEVFFIEKSLKILPKLLDQEKQSEFNSIHKNLIAQYDKKKQILFQLKKLYDFSFHNNIKLQKKNISITRLSSKVRKQQIRTKLKFFWRNLKKELLFLKKQTLFFKNQPHYFLIWKNKLWKSSRFSVPTSLKLRNTILSLYFLYGSKTKNLVQQLFSLKKTNAYWMKSMLNGLIWTQPIFQKINYKDSLCGLYPNGGNRSIYKKGISKLQNQTHFYHKNKFNSLIRSVWKTKLISLTKARIITKKRKLFSLQTLRLIRFHQKKLPKRFQIKNKIKSHAITGAIKLKRQTTQTKSFSKKKNIRYRRRKRMFLKEKLKYRLSYRLEYKKQLKLFTNFKLKFLIQDFIQKFFAIRLYVKLVWPLTEFKNLKFYRILFRKQTHWKIKRTFLRAKIQTKPVSLMKRYVFISNVTKHVHLRNSYQSEKNKKTFLKKIYRKLMNNSPFTNQRTKRITKIKKQTNRQITQNIQRSKQRISNQIRLQKVGHDLIFPFITNSKNESKKNILSYNVAPNTSILKSQKKNAYLSQKLKMLQMQAQKRLHWAAKAQFMSNLVTTLILFAKYLDPQPLADALAKVIGSTKKHVSALRLVETVLRTLKFKRGVGYRIALTGRANGAEKSNVMYLKKLKRNRPRQTFSKNVNFAMAQARATIGAFGIKIWVYY